MDDLEADRENLRLDISVLRKLLDAALDEGPPNSPLVRAATHVLRDRRARLEQLESGGEHSA